MCKQVGGDVGVGVMGVIASRPKNESARRAAGLTPWQNQGQLDLIRTGDNYRHKHGVLKSVVPKVEGSVSQAGQTPPKGLQVGARPGRRGRPGGSVAPRRAPFPAASENQRGPSRGQARHKQGHRE
ncbi:hypothetical protein O3P69_008701 [Scylla paramamosain]|uniref:Uncharacterized protein n=1 Tax=Scylla paramamosain TaxID=85552 RepID=A0AAW0SL72_SCYPA